jgi:multiple sugar transport system permease protein
MTTGKLDRPAAGAATGGPRDEAVSAAPARSRRRGGRAPAPGQGRLTPYLFLAPYLVLFVLFVLAPIVYGLWISLHDWDFTLPGKPFVGLTNYTDLFSSTSVSGPTFWQSMRATGIFTLLSVPLLLVVPLGVALLMHQKFPGRNFFRAVYFAPYVLGVAVVTVLWRYLLDNNVGLVNYYLGLVGLGPYPFTTALPWAWVAMVGMTVWWTLGFNAVIYLAGLQDIPRELYEAAEVDGAGSWARFRNVTLPGLRPVLLFVVSVTILASANMFGQAYIMTQGAPGNATRTAIYFIADEGLKRFQMGAASAMSFVLTFFLAAISMAVFFLFRQKEA